VTWKERKIFLGAKNPYHTAILHLFKCPFLSKKLVAYSDMWGASFANNKTLKIDTKSLKTS